MGDRPEYYDSPDEISRCCNGNMHGVNRGYQEHDDNYHPVQHCDSHYGQDAKNTTDNSGWIAHRAYCKECGAIPWKEAEPVPTRPEHPLERALRNICTSLPYLTSTHLDHKVTVARAKVLYELIYY